MNQNIKRESYDSKNTSLFGSSNEITNKMTSVAQNQGENPGKKARGDFIIMAPLYNPNYIVGALADETVGKAEVDFKKIFGENDIQLRAFPKDWVFVIGVDIYLLQGVEK